MSIFLEVSATKILGRVRIMIVGKQDERRLWESGVDLEPKHVGALDYLEFQFRSLGLRVKDSHKMFEYKFDFPVPVKLADVRATEFIPELVGKLEYYMAIFQQYAKADGQQ